MEQSIIEIDEAHHQLNSMCAVTERAPSIRKLCKNEAHCADKHSQLVQAGMNFREFYFVSFFCVVWNFQPNHFQSHHSFISSTPVFSSPFHCGALIQSLRSTHDICDSVWHKTVSHLLFIVYLFILYEHILSLNATFFLFALLGIGETLRVTLVLFSDRFFSLSFSLSLSLNHTHVCKRVLTVKYTSNRWIKTIRNFNAKTIIYYDFKCFNY